MRTAILLTSFGLLAACTEQNIQVKNLAPTAEIVSPDVDAAVLFQGIPATFRGHVQDADNQPDQLEARWLIGSEEVCPAAVPSATGEVFCDISLPAGPTEIRLAVTDRGGLSGFAIDTFWARPSAEPTAEITSLSPTDQYFADQPVPFEGTVSDVEDSPEILTAWWESNVDGRLGIEPVPSATGRVADLDFLSEGDHQIRLYVEDRAGNISFDTEVVRIGPANRPPICNGITNPPDGGTVQAGTTAIFNASVTDPDVPGNLLEVTWTSDRTGDVLGQSTPTSDGQIVFPFGGLSVDTHIITMEAKDSFGQTCTAFTTVIVDSPPVVQITSPEANRVYEAGTPVTFAATATDAEDLEQTLRVEWRDDLNGDLPSSNLDVNGNTSFPYNNLAVGQHLITLTVTDSAGLETQVSQPYIINALPTQPVVEITPFSPRTTDTLRANLAIASTDADNDSIDYDYQWSRNNVVDPSEVTETFPIAKTEKGDVIRVEVTPSDPYGDGDSAVAETTVLNSPPELGQVSLLGSPAFESSTLTCQPSLESDADSADTVTFTYSWLVNGTPVPETGQTLTGARFSRDDTVACQATPTDGTAAGTTVTSTPTTVLNTPPEVATVSVEPANPESGTLLTCSYDFTDTDGDDNSSTVTWRSGGIVVATGPTWEVDLDAGVSLSCAVQANDGTATGNTESAQATVATSAPTIDGVTISPDTPDRSTPLTCAYTGFADPQGQADQSRYQWTVNGMNAGTSATLSSGFAKGDSVTCTVTPSDGSNDGVAMAASATIRNTPPTAPTLDIDPAFPLAGLDDVECCIRTPSTDADLETVTYQFGWTIDGAPYFGATATDECSTFPSTDFVGLEQLVCTVTPSDSDESGPSASRTLTTLPSIEPKLATGGSHTCSLDRRGEVACWGLDQDGRITPPPDIFLDLDGGLNYTCGILEDQTLSCWGRMDAPSDGTRLEGPSGTYTNVSAGENGACATPSGGGVLCWGTDADGQVTNAPSTGQYIDVAVGTRHVCGLRDSGNIVCWGDSAFGITTPPAGTFTEVAAGANHTCAVAVDGSLACWGNNGDGKATPPSGVGFAEVGAGLRHSCAVRDDGTITCWGSNNDGRSTPVATDGGGAAINYLAVDLWIHTCAVDDLGRPFCWGRDDEGQSSP